jgi:large subunit ribosomal protein L32e
VTDVADPKTKKSTPARAGEKARAKREASKGHKGAKGAPKGEARKAAPTPRPEAPATPEAHKARPKPKLTPEQSQALGARRAKKAVQPAFRRHEWWRYKRLGGKHASWRLPRGLHSKTRRHWGYRPPVVSIGYRGPAEVRGLHPSGFEEVLVFNPADLAGVDKATQAARVGGTVGGRKAKLIEAEAEKLGIRILNPRGVAAGTSRDAATRTAGGAS